MHGMCKQLGCFAPEAGAPALRLARAIHTHVISGLLAFIAQKRINPQRRRQGMDARQGRAHAVEILHYLPVSPN